MIMKASNFPKMKFLLIIPVFAILMLSGCTSQGGVTLGNGVKILNWEPDFSSVYSGDRIQLRIRLQNQGEVTARNVRAVITGINIDEWGLSNNEAKFYDMLPPDRIQNTEGQIKQETFDLVAPNLPKGTTQTFTPQVRVYYDYRTTASKLITIVNDQELRRLQDQGKSLPTKDTVTSVGPIKVTINAGKFLKVRDESTGFYSFTKTFPITIDIQNIGGGTVSAQGTPSQDYKVKYRLEYPTNRLSIECPNTGNFGSDTITLWKGESASITCNVRIIQSPISSEEANIKAFLEYPYYIDASTTISVTGSEETGIYGR